MARRLLSLSVRRAPVHEVVSTSDVRIVLVLTGTVAITVGDDAHDLQEDDVLLINMGDTYRIDAQAACFIEFDLDASQIRLCSPSGPLRFSLDSKTAARDDTVRIRDLLSDAVAAEYEHGTLLYATNSRIFYELASLLIGRFAAVSQHESTGRMDEIYSYIEEHASEQLTLSHMGEVFFVTPQYFSRYFKEHSDMTFHRYLTQVRVKRAADALRHSDVSITRIALDSGFPSTEALRTAFQAMYHITPAAFRAKEAAADKQEGPEQGPLLEDAVLLLGGKRPPRSQGEELISVNITAIQSAAYTAFWRDAIDLGDLALLESYERREQLAEVQRQLSFSYVRFGVAHVLADYAEFGERAWSFHVEDQHFNYLYQLELRPWIKFEFSPEVGANIYSAYLNALIAHCANRFDISYVRTWRVELAAGPAGLARPEAYRRCFEQLSALVERFDFETAFIGPGISLARERDLNGWDELLRHGLCAPVQSFYAEPGIRVASSHGGAGIRMSDASWTSDQLQRAKQGYLAVREQAKQIMVTDWSCTVPAPSVLHDSCYRGALTIKNFIACFGEVSSLATSSLFDIADITDRDQGLLFGGDGMVTKDGIPKPAFFAYELMNRVGSRYVARSEHALVFSNGDRNYQIICHNCRRLSSSYYVEGEGTEPRQAARLFEDSDGFVIRVRLAGVKDGTYIIKQRTVSPAAGSIQDELLRMAPGNLAEAHPNDIEYLKRVSVPALSIDTAVARHGVLSFSISLEANAFAEVHAVYQIS